MFLRAIDLKPEPSTYFNLAHAYLAADDTPKAMQALEDSLALDPAQSDALANLGTMYLKEARFTEAAATLEKAIAVDGNDWQLRHMLGIAYEQAGELHKALAAYEKAKELQPQLPDELIKNCETKIKAAQALEEAIKNKE
jgi:Flp pilus assembly protein TadD